MVSKDNARMIELGSHAGGRYDERNGVGFVQICEIFETEDTFFLGTKPMDRQYRDSIKYGLRRDT